MVKFTAVLNQNLQQFLIMMNVWRAGNAYCCHTHSVLTTMGVGVSRLDELHIYIQRDLNSNHVAYYR